ncbi:Lrp/AsnC family transcriptional regulator [Ideonella sp.]|uniref:siroheme decarboxylase subunit beta n=1 Tax=Ideonella sp. TaxID=1929293 RepID=UPI002B47EAA8|nr:Lrp/AsnC family transcriptional regulator [Ideonella sp.]HJV69023.1 Lrp/AsnC family transcriptional regulator [Ideonella sp.]
MNQLALLNDWQHDFPLEREPFATVAALAGASVDEVLAGYAAARLDGSLSRIGGVFGGGAGGAAMLCAMAVPPARLASVAALVSAHPGVNHNYEREHPINLWFVLTAPDASALAAALAGLEAATGLAALRLPMQRAYRIDLGFDLRGRTAAAPRTGPHGAAARPVAPADRSLAALVEDGLPLLERPFDAWAEALGRTPGQVLDVLRGWLAHGTLKRFGTIVRHHELGFAANAMTVFDVPDDAVDACGEALARTPGVTLAYRRARAEGWPFNLYCMVHGRDRVAVHAVLDAALAQAGLAACPRAVLFSRRRYKQTGGRYFADARPALMDPMPHALVA